MSAPPPPANQRAPISLILLIILTQECLRVKSADWISCLWSRKSSNISFSKPIFTCVGFLVRVSVMRAIDTIIVFFKIKYRTKRERTMLSKHGSFFSFFQKKRTAPFSGHTPPPLSTDSTTHAHAHSG